MNFEVRFGFVLRWFWFAELRMFTQVIVVELLDEGLVCRFGYNTFFFENRQNTHGLDNDVRSSDDEQCSDELVSFTFSIKSIQA